LKGQAKEDGEDESGQSSGMHSDRGGSKASGKTPADSKSV